ALDCIPFEQWQSNLVSAVRQSEDNALASMLSFFTEIVSTERSYVMQQMHLEGVAPAYDCRRADRGLQATDLGEAPPIGDRLLSTFLRYFLDSGFLHEASSDSGHPETLEVASVSG
ncbi:MAG: hypothetical protein AAFX40_17490, partial [Cyanobacteria bacterium J06639_1]